MGLVPKFLLVVVLQNLKLLISLLIFYGFRTGHTCTWILRSCSLILIFCLSADKFNLYSDQEINQEIKQMQISFFVNSEVPTLDIEIKQSGLLVSILKLEF